MIHVLDNGLDYSDHSIYFIESDLTAEQLKALLKFIATMNDEPGECWTCAVVWLKVSLIASGTLTFFHGKPGELAEVLEVDQWCDFHRKALDAKLAELRAMDCGCDDDCRCLGCPVCEAKRPDRSEPDQMMIDADDGTR